MSNLPNCQPNLAYYSPNSFGGIESGFKVDDIEVDNLIEIYEGNVETGYLTAEFLQIILNVYCQLGSPDIQINNAWSVFSLLKNCFK